MGEMVRFSVLCITACFAFTFIAQGSRVMASAAALVCMVVFLKYALEQGAFLTERIGVLLSASGMDIELIKPVLKVLGISLCAKVTFEICRDMGNGGLAGAVEVFAHISSLICMLPLLEEVLKLVGSI